MSVYTPNEINLLADARDFVELLDRKLVSADFREAEVVGVDLRLLGRDFVMHSDHSSRFMASLRNQLTRKGRLTDEQLRAAINIYQDEAGLLKKESRSVTCFVCRSEFSTYDDLKAHKVLAHEDQEAPGVLTEDPTDLTSLTADGEAVIEDTSSVIGLDISELQDANYAVPNVNGVGKDDFVFIMVKRVRRTVKRDRRYVYGKITTGSEIVLAGTIEVKIWSSDSKELVGEQKPGDVYRGALEEELQMVMSAPEAFAKLFGKMSGHCCMCRKTLTDDVSRAIGMGLECEKKTNYFKETPKDYVPYCPTCESSKGYKVRGKALGIGYDGSAKYKCSADHIWRTDKKGEVIDVIQ